MDTLEWYRNSIIRRCNILISRMILENIFWFLLSAGKSPRDNRAFDDLADVSYCIFFFKFNS